MICLAVISVPLIRAVKARSGVLMDKDGKKIPQKWQGDGIKSNGGLAKGFLLPFVDDFLACIRYEHVNSLEVGLKGHVLCKPGLHNHCAGGPTRFLEKINKNMSGQGGGVNKNWIKIFGWWIKIIFGRGVDKNISQIKNFILTCYNAEKVVQHCRTHNSSDHQTKLHSRGCAGWR